MTSSQPLAPSPLQEQASDQLESPAIDILGLAKVYDGPLVVDHIDLSVGQGEFVTLLGPSGSGKTSTLMMVAGFETPTSGDIRLAGRSIVEVPAKKRDLGIVFQSYALFPHMTILENVAFPLRMRKVPKAQRLRTAAEMLERMHLDQFLDRRPRQLSGGQQQRVALARALVFEPKALLLDEPLGALDKRLRDQLQTEIKTIQQKMGISVLFVTHDQSEAMMMSDRIAVMNHGRIEQLGAPEEIYSRPASSFVATFLGETNLLPCSVGSLQGDVATVTLSDGTRSGAHAPGGTRSSGDMAISVRPERLRILTPNETATCTITGTVTSSVFLGSAHRVLVEGLGQELVALLGDSAHVPALRPGDEVCLGWNPEDAQLLQVCEMVTSTKA
jgi:putative spermidine/putrescine transport system ATP-binding protein